MMQQGMMQEMAVAADEMKEKLLRLAQDAYSGSSTFFDANVRARIIDDIYQFNSEHPTNSKYRTETYKLKSKFFRPKTRSAIRKNEAIAAAAYFSSEDIVSVRPVDDNNEMHRAAAEVHHELLQYRLTRPKPHGLPWFLTCMGAYQDAQTAGLVCSVQDWIHRPDKGIDRPDVTLMPIENVRFDPAADWRDVVESSPYLILMLPMYVKDVKARMALPVQVEVEVDMPDGSVGIVAETQYDKNGRPWNYYSDDVLRTATMSTDTIRSAREGGATDSKKSTTAISDFDVVWVHQNFVEVNGEDVFYYTLGTTHLLSEAQPIRSRYPQGRPVVIGFSIVEAHKAYKSSLPSMTRDTQAEINDVANLRVENVKLRLGKRYFAKRGSSIDLRSLTRNTANSVTLMNDPNSDVRVVTTDDATASSYQEQDRLNLDFDDLCGAFSGSSVQSNRSLNETVGGLNLIADNANMVSEYQLRTFTETWVEPVLRQLIILEQAYETDARVLKIVGDRARIGQFGFEAISDEIIEQETMLSVAVGTGSTNPQQQVERFMYGMEALARLTPEIAQRIKPEELVPELFGKLGYKDGSRFFEGIGEEEQQEDPRLAEAMQMIEQLQQQLAQKHPPELIAAQIAKTEAEAARLQADKTLKDVQAMAKRVDALYGAMNTAQTAVTVPGVTPVADAIAGSAGFVDQDAPPVYPQGLEPQQIPEEAQMPSNTSPNFPARAESGVRRGIESGENF